MILGPPMGPTGLLPQLRFPSCSREYLGPDRIAIGLNTDQIKHNPLIRAPEVPEKLVGSSIVERIHIQAVCHEEIEITVQIHIRDGHAVACTRTIRDIETDSPDRAGHVDLGEGTVTLVLE
ncbi:MAG: hypothetical protein AADX98_14130 [Thiocapsa sp. C3-3m]